MKVKERGRYWVSKSGIEIFILDPDATVLIETLTDPQSEPQGEQPGATEAPSGAGTAPEAAKGKSDISSQGSGMGSPPARTARYQGSSRVD